MISRMLAYARGHKEPIAVSLGSLFLIVFGWALAYFRLRHIEEPLILHFSDYTGINQIGSALELGVMGGIGLIIWAVNMLLAAALEARILFLARVTAYATLMMAILLFFAFMAIMSVNL